MDSSTLTTSSVLMIRPVNFAFNFQTAVNNSFQIQPESCAKNVQNEALQEFDAFAHLLRNNQIQVIVVSDTPDPHTPDSIFPNNIISFHRSGQVCLFPIFAPNRRAERKPSVLQEIQKHFKITSTVDLTHFEQQHKFLEGTGSMILDHVAGNVYACLSPRTHPAVVQEFCNRLGYNGTIVIFTAVDRNNEQIYHTNVMMCLANQFAVVCLECIPSEQEKQHLVDTLSKSNKTVVEISIDQLNNFAGNMLQVRNRAGDQFLVMSTRAYESLTKNQIQILEKFNKILHSKLNTIEKYGGGSARCMLAEIFLPLKN